MVMHDAVLCTVREPAPSGTVTVHRALVTNASVIRYVRRGFQCWAEQLSHGSSTPSEQQSSQVPHNVAVREAAT